MPRELLIYGNINQFSSSEFISQINDIIEFEPESELVARINTDGGSPEYGFGMISKYHEYKGEKKIKVDGKAYSMGFFFCLYSDSVEALDVSEFLVHRAAYDPWFEESSYFSDELKANLLRINKSLETAFRNKVDVAKFEEISGYKVKEIFSMDSRIDVFLSAKQAKAIGLVDKIVRITPSKKTEIKNNFSIAAKFNKDIDTSKQVSKEESNKEEKTKSNPKKNKDMTIEELKANHRSIYDAVFNLGSESGVANERDRAGAWLTFVDVDPEAVAKGVKDGEVISSTTMAELTRKTLSKEALKNVEGDSAKTVEPAKPEASSENKKSEGEKELDALISKSK